MTGRNNKKLSGGRVKRVILNILLCITAAILVFTAVSAIFFNKGDTFLFGYKPFIISSESMEPAYLKYGAVLIKNGGYDDVKVNELIAFKAEKIGGKPAFHRVVKITEEGFITKGDNNKIIDEQIVNRGAFIGREVWKTNATAFIIPQLQTVRGFVMLVIAPVLLIAAIILFVKILKKMCKKREEGYV